MAPLSQRNRPVGTQNGIQGVKALMKLKHNTGWTANTITKFIKSEIDGRAVDGKKVSQALRRGVSLGLLKVHDRKYRLKAITDNSYGEQTDKGSRRSRRGKFGGRKSRSGSRKRRRYSGSRRRRRR